MKNKNTIYLFAIYAMIVGCSGLPDYRAATSNTNINESTARYAIFTISGNPFMQIEAKNGADCLRQVKQAKEKNQIQGVNHDVTCSTITFKNLLQIKAIMTNLISNEEIKVNFLSQRACLAMASAAEKEKTHSFECTNTVDAAVPF
jgi:hypothetical protein